MQLGHVLSKKGSISNLVIFCLPPASMNLRIIWTIVRYVVLYNMVMHGKYINKRGHMRGDTSTSKMILI
jgi:hypothetical protein